MQATSELTDHQRINQLHWTLFFSSGISLFAYLTVFGPVFLLFLDELGLSKDRIGILTALFPLCGILALVWPPFVDRIGPKRVLLIFYGLRKVILAFILLAPLVRRNMGVEATFWFTGAIILGFSICRSLGDTAWVSWVQEIVPHYVRGRFGAMNSLVANLVTIAAVAVVSYVISHQRGLSGYLMTLGAGILIGLTSVLAVRRIPGGGPMSARPIDRQGARMGQVLRDGPMMRFVAGYCAQAMGQALAISFLPLFMKEQAGLSPNRIIFLDNGAILGAMASSIFWGRAADRRGSRQVVLLTVALLALLPFGWWMLPRQAPATMPLAMLLALVYGAAITGFILGANNHLYGHLVPPANRTNYLSFHQAAIGIMSAAGPFTAGQLLQHFRRFDQQIGPFSIDPYAPLFGLSIVLLLISMWLFAGMERPSPRTASIVLPGPRPRAADAKQG